MKIAAIILNYNTAEDCKKCVSLLKLQDYNLEIILVDNGSTKANEKQKLQEIREQYNVELIFNETNTGFSAGNNVGLRIAVEKGADWCLIINPDVEVKDPEYVKNMLQSIEKYPETVVAASKMILPNGERQNPYAEISFKEELLWMYEALKMKMGKERGYLLEDKTGYCQKLSGRCFFIKSSFLEEIDFLDEHVFLYCKEPILSSQVRQHGYQELYVSELQAYHNHIPSQKGSTRNRMQKLLTSRIYYLKNYSEYRGGKLVMVLASKRIQKLFWKIKG